MITPDNLTEALGAALFALWSMLFCVMCIWMFRRAQKRRDTEMAFISARSITGLIIQLWMTQSYVMLALDTLLLPRPGDLREIEWIRMVLYAVAQYMLMQTLCTILRAARHVRRAALQITLYGYLMLALASWSAAPQVRLVVAALVSATTVTMWVFIYRWTWRLSERTTAIGAVMILMPFGFLLHVAVWLLTPINWPVLPAPVASVLFFLVDFPLYGLSPFVIIVSRWRITCKETDTVEQEIWNAARSSGHSARSLRHVDSYRNGHDFSSTRQVRFDTDTDPEPDDEQ